MPAPTVNELKETQEELMELLNDAKKRGSAFVEDDLGDPLGAIVLGLADIVFEMRAKQAVTEND